MTTNKKHVFNLVKKTTVLPLMFNLVKKNDSVTPYVLFGKKKTVLPLMFYFIKINSVTPCLFSMTTKENQHCYPYGFYTTLCFIW